MKKFMTIVGTMIATVALFCLIVLVMASAHDRTFGGEIKSWFPDEKKQEETSDGADSVSLTAFAAEDPEYPTEPGFYVKPLGVVFEIPVDAWANGTESDDFTRIDMTWTDEQLFDRTLLTSLDLGDHSGYTIYVAGGRKYCFVSLGGFEPVAMQLPNSAITATLYVSNHRTPTYAAASFKLGSGLPGPKADEREGYDFVGWFMDEDLTLPYDGRRPGQYGEMGHTDMHEGLYPKYEIKHLRIELNANGGDELAGKTVDYGTQYEPPTPTREGYDFDGWIDQTGEPYTGGEIKEDLTLTAQWTQQIVSVSFVIGETVYKTLDVGYGMTVDDAMAQAGLRFYAIVSAENAFGEALDLDADSPIKESVTITLRELDAADKAATFFRRYWWIFVVAFVVLFLVIALPIALKQPGGKR